MRWTSDTLFAWAKANRKDLARVFFAKKKITESTEKIAIFMAGSPGAGKTEFISRLLTEEQESSYYVIDLDEIRQWMPEYRWNYAEKYTRWAIKILEMIFDECVSNNYNFILDGTFTNTDVIDRNICRLIDKGYTIHVFYIHTQPYLAWVFTLLRWSDDKRRIPITEFIRYYHLAYQNILLAEEKYDGKIHIHVAQKIRNKDGMIQLDDTIYDPDSIDELRDIFDKKVKYHYTLWKEWIIEILLFHFTKFLSLIPIIWKLLLRYIASIQKQK